MVSDGYKDTEIGVIPESWEVVKLEDTVKKLQSGGTPLSSNSDFYDGDIPFVKIDDITRSGKYLFNTKVAITKNGLDSSSAWLVPVNSILYSMYASIGFVSINKVEVSTNQAIMNIIPDGSKITLEFLYQYLLDLKGKIDKFIDQTTQKNLNAQKVRNFKIPLPPLKEQEKIADILSTADDKIDAIATQIEKAETLKKGLLQKLLSEGIGHSEFKDSELGKIPTSWEVEKLRNTTSKITDGSHFSPIPMKNTGYMIATVKDMTDHKFDYTACVNISNKEFNSLKANGCMPKINDVLFSKDGTIGKTFVFQDKLELVLLSSIAIIRPKEQILNSFYLVQVLKSNIFYKQLKGLSSGSALKRLVLKAINDIKIPLPPLEEQKQIADILLTADEKLEVLRGKKKKYETLKKGLLQKLLSGEVRV
jgi:type I restriction enzyme, S subunit